MGRSPGPVLIVDGTGKVSRTSASAVGVLGGCVGRPCATLVGVRDLRGAHGCHVTCAADLVATGGVREVVGAVRGEVHRVACSAVGGEVVVVLEPLDQDVPEEGLPSPRELEVLELVAQGRTNARIAVRLGVSPATVRTHLERVRTKLGARTRAEAVARALALGLLSR